MADAPPVPAVTANVGVAGAFVVTASPPVPGTAVRIELRLPPGWHEVGVRLLTGHGDRMAVRVRQPEQRDDQEASTD